MIVLNDDLYNFSDISTQALLSLSLLFSPVTIKKKNENWRPSRVEVQETIFFSLEVKYQT